MHDTIGHYKHSTALDGQVNNNKHTKHYKKIEGGFGREERWWLVIVAWQTTVVFCVQQHDTHSGWLTCPTNVAGHLLVSSVLAVWLGLAHSAPSTSIKQGLTLLGSFTSLALASSFGPCGDALGPRAGLGASGEGALLDGEMGVAWAASWRKMRSLLLRVHCSSSLPSAVRSKLNSRGDLGFLGLRPRLLGLESSRMTLAGGRRGSSGADRLPCNRDGNFFLVLTSLSESVNSNSVPTNSEIYYY